MAADNGQILVLPGKQLLLEELKQVGVVQPGHVHLRSGAESNTYFNIKKAYGTPKVLRGLAQAMNRLVHSDTTCLVASGIGGIALATAMSLESDIPVTFVRDSAKNHGRQSFIEGYEPSALDVATLVDDVFTSGSSLCLTIANIADTEVRVARAAVVVKRGEGALPVSLTHLFTAKEITD